MSIFDFATGDLGVLNKGVSFGVWISGEILNRVHGSKFAIQEKYGFFASDPSHFAGNVIDVVENEAFLEEGFFDSFGTVWV